MTSTDPHICSFGEANIYSSDLASLDRGRWLTDAILDFAKEFYLEELDSATKAKISIVSPVFCQMLRFCSRASEISSLCNDFGLSSAKWTLFLLNNSTDFENAYSGTHWSLLMFSPQASKTFSLFDSISNNHSSNQAASQIAEAVGPVLGAPVDNLTIADSSKQQNSSDCGMYTIEHMGAIIQAVKNGTTEIDLDRITPSYIADRREEWKQLILRYAAKSN